LLDTTLAVNSIGSRSSYILGWCKATEFRKDLFTLGTESDLEHSGGLLFAVDAFFDGSKTRQTALVGAYEACAGKNGSFFMVLAWPWGTAPVIRFVRETDIPFGMLDCVSGLDAHSLSLHGMRPCHQFQVGQIEEGLCAYSL
jgi:hypothetical protein